MVVQFKAYGDNECWFAPSSTLILFHLTSLFFSSDINFLTLFRLPLYSHLICFSLFSPSEICAAAATPPDDQLLPLVVFLSNFKPTALISRLPTEHLPLFSCCTCVCIQRGNPSCRLQGKVWNKNATFMSVFLFLLL